MWLRQPAEPNQWRRAGLPARITDVPGGHRRQMAMTRHEWLKRIARRFGRRGVGRFGFQLGVLFALGTYWSICVRNRHEPAVGRSTYNVGHLTDWPGRLCHLGDCDCCARSDAGIRRRRDGRNNEALAPCGNRRVLRSLRSTGDDFIHWSIRGGCIAIAASSSGNLDPWALHNRLGIDINP